jgi:hypothetical protein
VEYRVSASMNVPVQNSHVLKRSAIGVLGSNGTENSLKDSGDLDPSDRTGSGAAVTESVKKSGVEPKHAFRINATSGKYSRLRNTKVSIRKSWV